MSKSEQEQVELTLHICTHKYGSTTKHDVSLQFGPQIELSSIIGDQIEKLNPAE